MLERRHRIKGPGHLLRHVLALAAVVALIAGHGAVLQLFAAYTSLSLALVLTLGGLIAVKHLGLLGPAYAALRRYFDRKR